MTVWLVLVYDEYQYQGRASVRAVYATEQAAEQAAAVLTAEFERDEDYGMNAYVQDYEVQV